MNKSIERRVSKLETLISKNSRLNESSQVPGLSSSSKIDDEWFSAYGKIPETGRNGHMKWLTPSQIFKEKVREQFDKEIESCAVKLFYDPETFEDTPYIVDIDLILGGRNNSRNLNWITNQHTFASFRSAVGFINSKILSKPKFNGLGNWNDWEYLYN